MINLLVEFISAVLLLGNFVWIINPLHFRVKDSFKVSSIQSTTIVDNNSSVEVLQFLISDAEETRFESLDILQFDADLT